jgi:hypothetical protein
MGPTPLKPSRHRERIYLAIAILPMVLVIITLVGGVVRELACAAEVDKIVEELRNAGEPTDFQSSQLEERRKFPVSEVVKRVQTSNAIEHLEQRYANFLHSLESESCSLDDEAKMRIKKEVVTRYFDDARPIIARSQDLGHFGGSTKIMESAIAIAVQTGDRERAMEFLKRVGFNQETQKWFVNEKIWADEDLPQLRKLVNAGPSATQECREQLRLWRTNFLVANYPARAVRLPNWQYRRNFSEAFGLAPSLMLSQLKFLDGATKLTNIGTVRGMESLKALEDTQEASLVSVPFASHLGQMNYGIHLWHLAERCFKSDMTKRHFSTAIAIKQFKYQEGRWPNSLDELTKVGLTSADWKIVGEQDFGYEIQTDRSEAILWTGGFERLEKIRWHDKAFRTPTQLPSEVYPPNIAENLQIVIR